MKKIMYLFLLSIMVLLVACDKGSQTPNDDGSGNDQTQPEHTHEYGNVFKYDATNHWNECSCGEKSNIEAHKGGEATAISKAVCSVCGTKYGDYKLPEVTDGPTNEPTSFPIEVLKDTENVTLEYNGTISLDLNNYITYEGTVFNF